MIGERVRLAREACRLTQKSLAVSSGVPPGTIGSIENGLISEPSDNTIFKISVATGFPVGFFYLGQLPDMPEGRFRHKKRVPAKDRMQIRAQVRQTVELVQRSEQCLRLPKVTLSPITPPLDMDQIERLAVETREKLGIGQRDPIPNFTRAVERAGVVVVRLPYVPGCDSYSVWPDYGFHGRPIIAIVGDHPGDRDRANVGHELGHLLLHTEASNIEYDPAETEAWRFAGAILLPVAAAHDLMRRHLTMRVLMAIKANYGTSMSLTIRRAYDLGLISNDHYSSLNKQLSARGWRTHEPVPVHNEETLLIKKIISHMSDGDSLRDKNIHLNLQDQVLRKLLAPVSAISQSEGNVLTFPGSSMKGIFESNDHTKEVNDMPTTGEKPGKGTYKCLRCGQIVVLDDATDTLPPCPSCSGTEFVAV
jgi:Zn-dependent peptidase ImmA (M78 family)/transcriptional regulator with XRE-family HTH domain/DNA-directed RNA polymerase subunit RPC12/RpoP